jgi:hypothetical protein
VYSNGQQQPGPLIMFVGIAIAFAWLLFLGLWLFFYASGFSIMQNRGFLCIPCRYGDIRDVVVGSVGHETTLLGFAASEETVTHVTVRGSFERESAARAVGRISGAV